MPEMTQVANHLINFYITHARRAVNDAMNRSVTNKCITFDLWHFISFATNLISKQTIYIYEKLIPFALAIICIAIYHTTPIDGVRFVRSPSES